MILQYSASRIVIVFLLILHYSVDVPAQTHDARGTVFWFGYMENLSLNFNGPPRFSVVVHAGEQTDGTISIPLTGLSIPFQLNAGATGEFFLPDAIYYPMGSNVFSNLAIKVESEKPVTVYAMHYRLFFTESTLVLPEAALGDEYVVLAARDYQSSAHPSELLVVAGSEGAVVEITPSTTTLSAQPAGVPFLIDLGFGATYQLQARGDLSGTLVRVREGGNVAVFGGAVQGITVSDFGADNHLFDQNYPVASWSDTYFAIPILNRGGDPVKILAHEDATRVSIGCREDVTLNAGEYYETTVTEPLCITASKNIAVAQFNKPQATNAPRVGDPTMLILPPATLATRQAGIIAPGVVRDSWRPISEHLVTLVSRTVHAQTVFLDGANIAGSFQPFPDNPEFSYARLSVAPGDHNVTAEHGVSAYAIGLGNYDAYSHTLGFDTAITVTKQVVDLRDTNICRGDSVQLQAPVGFDSYHWEPGFSLSNPDIPDPIAFPDVTTTYELSAIIGGCTHIAKLTVYVSEKLPLTVNGDTGVCRGDTAQLQASTGFDSYRWTPGGSLSDSTAPDPLAFPDETTTYRLSVTNGGCTQNIELTINVSDRIPLILPGDTSLCRGDSVRLQAPAGFDSYTWTPDSSLSDPGVSNPLAFPDETTTYRLTATNGHCTQNAEITVNVFDEQVLTLSLPDTTVKGGNHIDLPLMLTGIEAEQLPLRIDTAIIEIRFNSFVFHPSEVSRGTFTLHRDIDGFRILRLQLIDIEFNSLSQVLSIISGYGMYRADSQSTVLGISILNLVSESCAYIDGIQDGNLEITGCSLNFHNLRFFTPTTMSVASDLDTKLSTISVKSGERGQFRLQVISLQSRIVYEETWRQALENGFAVHDVHVQHERFAAGWYHVVLTTPTRTITLSMALMR